MDQRQGLALLVAFLAYYFYFRDGGGKEKEEEAVLDEQGFLVRENLALTIRVEYRGENEVCGRIATVVESRSLHAFSSFFFASLRL